MVDSQKTKYIKDGDEIVESYESEEVYREPKEEMKKKQAGAELGRI